MNRNRFLFSFVSILLTIGRSIDQISDDSEESKFIDIDYRKLVSRSDLDYNKPVSLSQAGFPIGTGTVVSMLWTSPTALKFQINRSDVYSINNSTNRFQIRHTDYASDLACVDINFIEFGKDV